MGFKIVDMVLAGAVLDDGTVTGIAYPAGMNQASFTGANAATTGKAIINFNDVYDEVDPGIGITYGASTITLTNLSGVTWPAGSDVTLQLGYVSALDAIQAGTLTATPAELNMSDADVRVETVTATNVITAAESGKTFFLDAVAGFLSTLPAPFVGAEFNFIVKTAPTSVGYTIATNGGANIMVIGINELEVDTADDGPWDDDADLLTFVANLAKAGDHIKFFCDGVKWYGRGQTQLDGGLTSATT